MLSNRDFRILRIYLGHVCSHVKDIPLLIFAMLQVGKEMLCLNQQSEAEPDQASPGFSLLMELLRDDQ